MRYTRKTCRPRGRRRATRPKAPASPSVSPPRPPFRRRFASEGQSIFCSPAWCRNHRTGDFLPDQGEGHEEHGGGEDRSGEVGAAEPEQDGGGGREDRTEGLSEAEDGAVYGDEGAPVLVGGSLVEEREGVGDVEALGDAE